MIKLHTQIQQPRLIKMLSLSSQIKLDTLSIDSK